MPLISVICSCYNHEKYIGKLLHSILEQTEQDFEIIIIDDCSNDSSSDVIKSFVDSRITLIQNKYNKGPNANLNTAIKIAKGDFLTFIGSDDIFFNNHFEVTTKYLKQHPNVDVFYCWLQAIDEYDNPHTYYDNVTPFSSTREEALKKMFYKENIFPSPGMTIRQEALKKISPLYTSLANYQDYLMNILLLINGDFYQSKETLVYYRRHKNNLSKNNLFSLFRSRYETSSLMNSFLNLQENQIKKIFSLELKELNLTVTDKNIPFILGLLALCADSEYRRLWGYSQVIDFLAKNSEQFCNNQDYDFKFLIELTEKIVNRFHKTELLKNERGFFEKLFYKLYRHLEKKRIMRI